MMEVREIESKLAQTIHIKYHYLHRRAHCRKAYGLFVEGDLKGVCLFGTPASPPLCKGLFGSEERYNIVELVRLWVDDSVPRNGESYLISSAINQCPFELFVSYADSSVGHVGYVYQATNWLYTGLSAKHNQWNLNGLHSKGIANKFSLVELRKKVGFSITERARKHRYVFIKASHKRRKALLKKLKYPVLAYPKFAGEVSRHDTSAPTERAGVLPAPRSNMEAKS